VNENTPKTPRTWPDIKSFLTNEMKTFKIGSPAQMWIFQIIREIMTFG
jgi:hypothetical protein